MKKLWMVIVDIADVVEKMVRGFFYIGLSTFLILKAIVVIPQNPNIPNWMLAPAVLICSIGCGLIVIKILEEPDSRDRRDQEKHDKLQDEAISAMDRRYK